MGALWNGIKAALGSIIAFFYGLIPDYGIAIILLTVAVSLVLFPLTLKQTRSMRKMQLIQPEIKRLQKEHKGNREELNQELMALYKREGVNPAAGCLPLLAQMPIWFALFQVLRVSVATLPIVGMVGIGTPGASANLSAGDRIIEVETSEVDSWNDVEKAFSDGQPHQIVVDRNGSVRTITLESLEGVTPTDQHFLDPDNIIPEDSDLADALRDGDTHFLGMDLLSSPSEAASDGIGEAIPYILLILLVMATGWYQQVQTTRTRSDQANPTQQQQSMQTVMKIMPLFLAFISWNFPTGLVVYFAASALFRIGQQAVILRLDERDRRDQDIEASDGPQPAESLETKKGPAPNTSKKRKRRRRK